MTMATTSVVLMTVEDAKELTNRIRSAADLVWRLLLEAHDRQAWKVLGYTTFRAYALAEFSMQKSQAYRLLDQGRVITALAAAASSPVGESTPIIEREARDIKPHLHLVADDVRARVEQGATPADAIRAAVEAARRKYAASRRKADQSNRIIEIVAQMAENLTGSNDLLDYSAVDPLCVESWVADLRRAATQLQRFASRLERATKARRGEAA